MNSLIIPLASPDPSLALVGGKAKNLSHLLRAGFPVPDGVVLTTVAYQTFVEANGLSPTIFEQSPIPAKITSAILTAYQELGSGPVAVRSSATAEDLAEASFAGQQESFLNVCGEEALLRAVRR
nr:hypothetical protein [Ardenticatenales bacterium]